MDIARFIEVYEIIQSENSPTYIQIAGYPRWENVWSNLLSFFLNDGPHNFRGFLVRCLSKIIGQSLGEVECVEREVYTKNRNRIDLYVTTDRCCFFIENKVGAILNNDLTDYYDYCKTQAGVLRESFGIVLSINKESVITPFWNVSYKELILQIEKDIHEVLYSADNRYFMIFIDFLSTIKFVLEGKVDFNKSFYEIYLQNTAKVKNIVKNVEKLNIYSAKLANEQAEVFRTWSIENIDRIWVWQKCTTVIDMKEADADLKIVFDLGFSPDGIDLCLHNRKKLPTDADLIGGICDEIRDRMVFVEGRFYLKEKLRLDESDKLQDKYFPLIEKVITKYNEKFT